MIVFWAIAVLITTVGVAVAIAKLGPVAIAIVPGIAVPFSSCHSNVWVLRSAMRRVSVPPASWK